MNYKLKKPKCHSRWVYKSVPGIGEISALKLKNEFGDMSQFSNEKKLFSYLGLTPVEYSSGDHIRQGHISRQGRSLLRHIFVESAWIAIKVDNELMTIYQRIAKKRGKKRAIVGIARRLAGRLRACLQQGTIYNHQIMISVLSYVWPRNVFLWLLTKRTTLMSLGHTLYVSNEQLVAFLRK